MTYLYTVVGAVVYTEFVGYWLHILLHSEKVPALSRAHMLHHLRDYGPKKPLHRSGAYLNSAESRTNFLGVGMEWFLPVLLIISGSLAMLWLLGVPASHQIVFLLTGILWGHFLFGHMHSAMHLTDFWMLKVPVLNIWFRKIRQLHDFHHLQISADGRMQKNYGICFFWFDRLFGSYSPKPKEFNHSGHEAALVRYKNVLN
jgi:sterol desaturase/sphingolipid hydroxylase (fatty acid hydroxylase superfamily)